MTQYGSADARFVASPTRFLMPLQSYRELIVWQHSVELTIDVYRLTRGFPPDERFGITAQVRRAAMSITNNIAEGHGRATRGEFLNSLSIARGSANEVENCLLVSQRLQLATPANIEPLLTRTNQIFRMLAKFRVWIRDNRR
jgi:four helix bundle protein